MTELVQCWKCRRRLWPQDFPSHRHRHGPGGAFVYGRSGFCRDCHVGSGHEARHRKRGDVDPQFPFVEWGRKRRRSRGLCAVCGARGDCVDHIVPFGIGGALTIENLRPVCYNCNAPRRAPDPERLRAIGAML